MDVIDDGRSGLLVPAGRRGRARGRAAGARRRPRPRARRSEPPAARSWRRASTPSSPSTATARSSRTWRSGAREDRADRRHRLHGRAPARAPAGAGRRGGGARAAGLRRVRSRPGAVRLGGGRPARRATRSRAWSRARRRSCTSPPCTAPRATRTRTTATSTWAGPSGCWRPRPGRACAGSCTPRPSASTDTSRDPPADETTPFAPGDVYQDTKAEAETLATGVRPAPRAAGRRHPAGGDLRPARAPAAEALPRDRARALRDRRLGTGVLPPRLRRRPAATGTCCCSSTTRPWGSRSSSPARAT